MPTTIATVSYDEINCVAESDLDTHTDDDFTVNAIRNGKLVPCRWSDLTDDERRAAYVNIFNPCNIY